MYSNHNTEEVNMDLLTETESSPPDRPSAGVVGVLQQTGLLLKKNWLCKIRMEKKKLAGEILAPILYLALLWVLVKAEQRHNYPVEKDPLETSTDVTKSLSGSPPVTIHIVPDTAYSRNITNTMDQIWLSDSPSSLKFEYHKSESELLDKYRTTDDVVVAIILPNSGDKLNYTIRINPDASLPPISRKKEELSTCREGGHLKYGLESAKTCPVNGYFYSDFLALQSLVDQAFVHMSVSPATPIKVTMENYPKPEFLPGMATFLRVLIPIYSVIPMTQLINNLLVLIVTEKESRIKDGLKMIGISDAAYWLSWFGVYGAIVTFFAVAFTSVMYFLSILRNISPLILFLLFWTFGLSVVTFAFVLTAFFHKPKTAGVVGTLVLQFTGMLFLVQTFVSGSGPWLIPLRLISSLAFTTALDIATEYEYTSGIQWRDLQFGGNGEGILYSLIFLVGDTLLYGLIAVYLDNVLPNEFGVRQHPLFCLMPSYWCGSKNNTDSYYSDDNVEEEGMNFEAVPSDKKVAITTVNIKKSFTSWIGSQKVEAVKGISLKIYEGQITAILGRNGAGKTTLFNMITGMVTPTSGKAIVLGRQVANPEEMAEIRKMTGVCMQNDLHFGALTVLEHLQFYGKFRGLKNEALNEGVNELLDSLKLNDRKDIAADKLSGGQKRKLSIGIALIGDPKIVLLDEPSAGVDPVSRRHLWSLLQRKKEGKVIVLTTHFLDEADILADRKAIIHDGILKCCGSSLFLKNRFGVGYHLTVELDDRNSDTAGSDNVINKWIPSALTSKKLISNELKYSLPHSAISNFPALFADIEVLVSSSSSGIKSYGVSMTTLEEVFLRISNNAEVTSSDNVENGENSEVPLSDTNLIDDDVGQEQNSLTILTAMCKLRILRMLRNPQSFFFMVFMPIIFVAIGFMLMKIQKVPINDEYIDFTLPQNIYPKADLNVAVSKKSADDKEFSEFLQKRGFTVHSYSGEFADLLGVNPNVGTMGAIELQISPPAPFLGELRVNGTFVHVPPLLLNAVNEYYQTKVGQSPTNRLKVWNRPFVSKHPSQFDQSTLYTVFLIGPAFIFIAVGMVMEIVYDREIRVRNQLRVNGLSFELYMGSMFIVYGLLSLFVTLFQIALMFIFGVPSLTNIHAITILIGMLILYIFPCLLCSAVFSYFFDRMESAQAVFSQVASLSGTFIILAVLILDLVRPQSNAALIVHSIFCVLDVYYIPLGIFYYVNKQYLFCSILGNCDKLSFSNYSGPEFIVIWVSMACQIPIFIFVLYVVDLVKDGAKICSAITHTMGMKTNPPNRVRSVSANSRPGRRFSGFGAEEDEDVGLERQKVASVFSGAAEVNLKCVVAVQNIAKNFPSVEGTGKDKVKKNKTVVDRVSFMVEEGEVFGLLGHNGAGKTTAMRMITAETDADSGLIKMCGFDISSNKSEAFLNLGYCPQHDALWENITLSEHIKLYAAIRGVPTNKINSLVSKFLQGLSIEEHTKKKARELSGGTKRKLSYAISMLGSPRIVLLDEPSTGMDPQSKRFLWNTIVGTFKDKRGAILTTHAMEEADALCTRIAIMVKGTILCIGSPQHLKSKFGAGYTLEVKLKLNEGDGEEDRPLSNFDFILESFPGSKLNEVFGNRAVFSVPNSTIQSISKTFALLEQLKSSHELEEYAFTQTTLEQVFLKFAKENEENEEN